MQVTKGAVRADLVGGTLDLFPLNFQIPHVVTINMALSLEACIGIEASDLPGVTILSKDYDKSYFFPKEMFVKEKLFFSDKFEEMNFMARILGHLNAIENLQITLSSDAPAGSGLGGSSSMGVVLYKAICRYKQMDFNPRQAIKDVQELEAGILMAGVAGYQDYYPAMFGGVLALHPHIGGEKIEQLFTIELKEYLEENMSLIFSGVSRNSGINNWEVYKKFYDKDKNIVRGLNNIAKVSYQAYESLKAKNYKTFLDRIIEEGHLRSDLFPQILGDKIQNFRDFLLKENLINGVKICGAGGGGCFLVIHRESSKEQIALMAKKFNMQYLDFTVGEIQH